MTSGAYFWLLWAFLLYWVCDSTKRYNRYHEYYWSFYETRNKPCVKHREFIFILNRGTHRTCARQHFAKFSQTHVFHFRCPCVRVLIAKHLAHHLAGRTLFKNVKIYNNFSDFLSLSNHIDEDMASKLANYVEFKVNGFPIAKPQSPDQMAYTWVPLQLNKPMKIQMTFNRWYASSLLSLVKAKVALPSWTSSRLVTLLDLLSLDICYERSLEATPDDEYFIADIICQNSTITKIINEPKSDSVYDLVKNYGTPGFFNLSINLPRVDVEGAEKA